jgi:hypothetical protein
MSSDSIHSDAAHGIAADVVREAETMVTALVRSHKHLLNAVAMAHMTVFSVGRDRRVTIIAAPPSYIGENRENAKVVLSRLIPTYDIQPFLRRLESVLDGHVTDASHECEIGTSFPPTDSNGIPFTNKSQMATSIEHNFKALLRLWSLTTRPRTMSQASLSARHRSGATPGRTVKTIAVIQR